MPKLPVVTSRKVISALETIGFYKVRQRGSHVQLKRGNLLVTIPVHSGDINPGTLKSILRQARLDINEFRKLL
jgi:predicted RNA binding protein YcfA (HicA-like mRNA interferase family)